MNHANLEAQAVLDRLLAGREHVSILEAGCGSTSHLRTPPQAELVGIDISEAQLAQNSHLHRKIQGDLETYRFPANSFDLIVCWDVLEHLSRPERALEGFLAALKPGGLVVIAVPNILSIKGLVTKLTPYWAHVWFYRYVMGDGSAGTERFRQFPTYLRWSVLPSAMRRFAQTNGLSVEHLNLYEGPVQSDLRKRRPLANVLFKIAGAASRALSLGRLDLCQSDCILVLRRGAEGRKGESRVVEPERLPITTNAVGA